MVRTPVIDASSELYGGYSSIGKIVHATMRIKVTTTISPWEKSISVPSPAQGSFRIIDSKGNKEFQINGSGIFQNTTSLEPGDYTVSTIYIQN